MMRHGQVFSSRSLALVGLFSLVALTGYYLLRSRHDVSRYQDVYVSQNVISDPIKTDPEEPEWYELELARDFPDKDLYRNFTVRANGNDVLLYLRIQKTGTGNFNRHLAYDFKTESICKSVNATPGMSECSRDEWTNNVLFLTGPHEWPCGTHADWTTLKDCAKDAMVARHDGNKKVKRLLYVTTVRDAVHRFLSEWLHVKRGATWSKAAMVCGGEEPKREFCYKTENWKGVSLEDFMSCKKNLAFNRQTRMLADLNLVNCYNTSGMSYEERHMRMLRSAMENLKSMAFFGLTEYQYLSQLLFEKTFQLEFVYDFARKSVQKSEMVELTQAEIEKIRELNKYDDILYLYAKNLFKQRIQRVLEVDVNL